MLQMSRIRAGRWEGLWKGTGRPDIAVLHRGAALAGMEAVAEGAHWRCSVPIPSEVLGDGVETFLIRVDGETAGRFSIAAGAVLAEDLVAEIATLRAELELLKQAFRSHCAQG